MKCVDLLNWSTTTIIESLPHFDIGIPVMKSNEITSHFHSGIGIGCINPANVGVPLSPAGTLNTCLDMLLYIFLHPANSSHFLLLSTSSGI